MKSSAFLLVIPTLIIFFFISHHPHSEQAELLSKEMTSCASATDQFAQFASDNSFVRKHDNPLPFASYQTSGSMVTYEVKDMQNANAYFVPSPTPSTDYLIVVHEWWGLNNYVKSESDRLAKELGNINVLALDIYDGKVADTREDARKYMQAVTNERAYGIIQGASQFIGPEASVFTIGWCFGGGWSLQTAIELGDKVKGCVMFYGMPENDLDRLSKLKADVLGVFAANEKWITPEVVSAFEKNMTPMDPSLQVKSYDAEHGFANPSNPKYDQEASKDAYEHVLAFISKRR